jgi:hypothetical protein
MEQGALPPDRPQRCQEKVDGVNRVSMYYAAELVPRAFLVGGHDRKLLARAGVRLCTRLRKNSRYSIRPGSARAFLASSASRRSSISSSSRRSLRGTTAATAFFPRRRTTRSPRPTRSRVGSKGPLGFLAVARLIVADSTLEIGPLTPTGCSLRETRPSVAAGADVWSGETPHTPPLPPGEGEEGPPRASASKAVSSFLWTVALPVAGEAEGTRPA